MNYIRTFAHLCKNDNLCNAIENQSDTFQRKNIKINTFCKSMHSFEKIFIWSTLWFYYSTQFVWI